VQLTFSTRISFLLISIGHAVTLRITGSIPKEKEETQTVQLEFMGSTT
jgi:hypothetical protein